MLVFVGLLITSTVSRAQSVSKTVNSPSVQYTQHTDATPNISSAPNVIEVEPSPQEVEAVAQQVAAENRIHGLPPDDWVALFTLALTLLTLLLWWSTHKSARIAGRALEELERPFVFVNFVQSGLQFGYHAAADGTMIYDKNVRTDNAGGVFIVEFVNHGRTPALLLDLLITFPIEAGTVLPYPLNCKTQRGPAFPVGSVSSPDRSYQYPRSMGDVYKLETARVNDLEAALKYGFYCVGHLRYADIFENEYVVGFCGKLSAFNAQFDLLGDRRFNYMRQTKWAGGKPIKECLRSFWRRS